MRNTVIALCLVLAFSLTAQPAVAVTIGFEPSTQVVTIGTPAVVSVVISDLVDFAAPSLGTFDLTVKFDSTIPNFTGAAYGDALLGDQLDLLGLGSVTSTTSGSGFVNLFELSLDPSDDLNSLQAGQFGLGTLF